SKRQGNVFNQEHIVALVGNYNLSNSLIGSGTIETDLMSGGFSDQNRINLQKILDYGGETLAIADSNINPILEIRIYYNSNTTFNTPNNYAVSLQNEIYDYIVGGSDLVGNTSPVGSTQPVANKLASFKDQIVVIQVDSNKVGEFRYPSSKAFYYAREVATRSNQNSHSQISDQQNIDNSIYSYIVDCWIVFNNPNQTSQ